MLRFAVQHEDVIEGWGWEGRRLQEVAELTEAVSGAVVHVEQRCIVQSDLRKSTPGLRLQQ